MQHSPIIINPKPKTFWKSPFVIFIMVAAQKINKFTNSAFHQLVQVGHLKGVGGL